MNICIGIPTGQRAQQAREVAVAWANRGIQPVVLTWEPETAEGFNGTGFVFIRDSERKSFAVNQNRLMREFQGWDVWICGADDLWPGEQEDLKDRIELVAAEAKARLIWVGDGFANVQCTHPIITRVMYNREKERIFDEQFIHNYTDTDLFARMLLQKRVVKCMDIMFDHRHYLSGKTEKDRIYELGEQSFAEDALTYNKKYGQQKINVNAAEVIEIEEFEDQEAV